MVTMFGGAEEAARKEREAARKKRKKVAGVGSTIAADVADPATPVMGAINPYARGSESREAATTGFTEALQPKIRKATDVVTSSVNPYMTGQVGASLLRDVQAPSLTALSEFETGQDVKAQDWEAAQQQQNIANLQALANSPDATAQDKENYRAAIAGREPRDMTTVDIDEGLTPAEKIERTNIEQAAAYGDALAAYSGIIDKIPGWITDSRNSKRASYKAYQRMEELYSKLEIIGAGGQATMSAEELAEFNQLVEAMKKGGMVGNYTETVFTELGYGDATPPPMMQW